MLYIKQFIVCFYSILLFKVLFSYFVCSDCLAKKAKNKLGKDRLTYMKILKYTSV